MCFVFWLKILYVVDNSGNQPAGQVSKSIIKWCDDCLNNKPPKYLGLINPNKSIVGEETNVIRARIISGHWQLFGEQHVSQASFRLTVDSISNHFMMLPAGLIMRHGYSVRVFPIKQKLHNKQYFFYCIAITEVVD